MRKKFTQFFLFLLLLLSVSLSATAQTYDNADKTALRNFLIQPSATTGVSNGQLLGLNAAQMSALNTATDWLTNESWVGSVSHLTWNVASPKRLTGIQWSINAIAGNLDVTQCTALESLYCANTSISALDVTNCTQLRVLNCSNTSISNLDVTSCTQLKDLQCSDNSISNLDVTQCTALIHLYCFNTSISALDVTNCTQLRVLNCANTSISNLEVTSCTQLQQLYCFDTPISALDISRCTLLWELDCFNTPISSLDVTTCTALEYLYCFNTSISALNVSKCTALKELYCGDTHLTSLDVTKCTALEILSCPNTGLTALDVTKCVVLNILECPGTSLTNLDVSQCTVLENLYCNNTNITALDISQCTALQHLHCYYTNLKFSTLPLVLPVTGGAYVYAPQNKINGGAIDYTAVVNLSSEYNINGNITTYTWYEAGAGSSETLLTSQPVNTNGYFDLTAALAGKTLRCKMTNAQFPDFATGYELVYEVKVNDVALPVQLSDFSAHVGEDCAVTLHWTSSAETDFSHYELERSSTGSKYETIYQANSNSSHSYYYTSPGNAPNLYYRLKMIDKDGRFSYSNVVPVRLSCVQVPVLKLIFNPVPAGNNIQTLIVAYRYYDKASLEVYNALGVLVASKSLVLQTGDNYSDLPIRKLSAGLYHIILKDNKGQIVQSEKLVIK